MKKKCYIAVVSLALVIFAYISIFKLFFSYPEIDHVLIDDPKMYLNVNESTKQLMNDYYSNTLFPKKENVMSDACVYNQEYDCSIFGNPVCSVYLKQSFIDSALFECEVERIKDISNQIYVLSNEKNLYSINPSFEQSRKDYLDELLQDGKTIVFEFVVVDSQTRSIEYLFAVQQDGQAKSNIIENLLSSPIKGQLND